MEVLLPILVVGGVFVVVILLIALLVLLRSYRIAPPNEAMIITGRGNKAGDVDLETGGARIIIGGRAIVRPLFERAFQLSLPSRQIPLEVHRYPLHRTFLRQLGRAHVRIPVTCPS